MAPTRAPRGSVSVYESGGFLRLNYKPKGRPRQRRSTGLQDTPENRAKIQRDIVSVIEMDLLIGQFKGDIGDYLDQGADADTTAGLFQRWMDYLLSCNVSASTIATHYRPLRTHLEGWSKEIKGTDAAAAFVQAMAAGRTIQQPKRKQRPQAPRTTNDYLRRLKKWGEWCEERGHWEGNHFTPIRPFPGARTAAKGEPFTVEEMARILEVMAEGSYAHYVDFVYFLFATGVRPGEAIALRWEHVDLETGTATICEALTRSRNGEKRKRKKPKTGDKGIRTLPLTDDLKTVLRGRRPNYCHPSRLVFPGPKGKAIDDHNFSTRCWKKTLAAAGVEHRKLYFARHSFASWAIAQGATLPNTAKLLGHTNSRMVQQTYARPSGELEMPSVPLKGKPSSSGKVVQFGAG